MMQRILVVDDEPDLTALVAYHLAKEGYRVSTAHNGREALELAARDQPDLVVLDLMLPGLSGFEILKRLRANEQLQKVGVVMLTAREETEDRVQGFALGADDYVVKPFSPQELVMRVKAVLRRIEAPSVVGGSMSHFGPISIDRASHAVAVGHTSLDLTATEYRLLLTLAERAPRVQTRGQLLQTVWQANPEIQTRTVDMHIKRLRAKLGPASDCIETVRGFGYRFRSRT